MFTDHNNTLVQESQDPRIAWPFGAGISEGGLNRAVPSLFWNALPPASSFLPPANPTPAIAFGADPRLRIPYAMEYNFGVQHAITPNRSEERRVGKECRARGSLCQQRKKDEGGMDASSRSRQHGMG